LSTDSTTLTAGKTALFTVVSKPPCVLGLGCSGIAARCGVGGRGDGCWKFPSVRPRASGRLRDSERYAASRSVPPKHGRIQCCSRHAPRDRCAWPATRWRDPQDRFLPKIFNAGSEGNLMLGGLIEEW